ncbi:MAG: molybdopterin molybdenumtransferase MoeA [Gammaproteobacteria bacterium]|nr:MAG: molybdopterin molybdenumtransferase MoeA [Gammaproteobacteria bacterium]
MNDCGCDSVKDCLTPFQDALDKLLEAAVPVTGLENIETMHALGRVLAESQISAINVPPADNSAMDGYAIISSDTNSEGDIRLKVTQRICAGETGKLLQRGQAARIFTGAPIPPGADAVLMQEHVEVDGDDIVFTGPVSAGTNTRLAGEDIATGDEVLSAGTCIRSQEMGLAASIGLSDLPVYTRIKVAIFFTGDELVEPGQPLQPGQIYDSNRYTLLGLLQKLGCEVVDLGVVGDTLEQTRQALHSAASQADLVITSGGVSVGEEDHVRIALEELGQLAMWRIAMKPGKPLAFGHVDGTPFLGLPGNPVSVFVTFCLFVSPFIKRMQGMSEVEPKTIIVPAGFDWPKPGKRREYVRARLITNDKGQRTVSIYSNQGSGVLTSTSWADGLVIIPIGQTVTEGDMVEYLSFQEIL